MASPTAATLVLITTEGLKKAGYTNPSATQLTRAQTEWMEEIKYDIFTLIKKPTFLQSIQTQVTTNGLNKYSMPSDFSSILSMEIMHGSHIGTAQAGGASTITLASDETSTEESVRGKEIFIYAGTGVGQLRQCISYDYTTKIATINPAWDTQPIATSSYMIIDVYYPLIQKPIEDFDALSYPTSTGTPTHYFPIGDADNGEFILYPTPYHATAPYGLKLRYYADLLRLDLAGTLMGTLYRRWRNVFVLGVCAKAKKDIGDSQRNEELKEYQQALQMLVMRETYGMDLNNLQSTVSDY